MNKTEIQSRIEKCESDLASLKADLAKCDEGIEQEKCWHGIYRDNTSTWRALKKRDAEELSGRDSNIKAVAYMPECRQVTAEDISRASKELDALPGDIVPREEQAKLLHKLGFRMKVTP